jgi:hypothetical protein
MTPALWLVLAGGAIGATVAVHGLVTLASSGRHRNDGDARAQRSRRRSGLYAVWFGSGLVLLSLSSLLNAYDRTPLALLTLAASLASVGVAVLRYRPRTDAG